LQAFTLILNPRLKLRQQPLIHEHLNDTPIVKNTNGSTMLSVDVVQTCVPKPCGHVIGALTKKPSIKEELMSLNMVFSAPMLDSRVVNMTKVS
jgi:hypothetical protein